MARTIPKHVFDRLLKTGDAVEGFSGGVAPRCQGEHRSLGG